MLKRNIIFLCVLMVIFYSYSISFGISLLNGINWLQSVQSPSGSWGSEWEFADTCDVLHTLREVSPDCNSIEAGLEWLAYEYAPNLEFLSRQIIALGGASDYEFITDSLVDELLLSRNESTTNTSLPNWPEGGWGLDIGYETDCITTAVGVCAVKDAGLTGGLAVQDISLGLEEYVVYSFEVPADAIKVHVYFEEIAGDPILILLQEGSPPTSGSGPLLSATGAMTTYPDNGYSFTPGTNYMLFYAPYGPTTFSVSISYETPDRDVRALHAPLTYLRQAQNADGGWGLQRGIASDLYTTLHVLLALQKNTEYGSAAEITAGMGWLRSQQLGDGSFGYDGIGEAVETALATCALIEDDGYPFQTDTLDAISYLENTQQPNGSWNDEPYDTALAVLALDNLNQVPVADAGPDQWLIDTDTNLVESVTLDASASSDIDGSIISYVWTENGETIATSVNPTVEFRMGTYNLTLTVTDDGGKTATDSVEIKITPQPQIFYSENMDTDPNWTTEGLWQWGIPQGNDGWHGGSPPDGPDPTSGFTGSNVYGYNLAGAYEDNLPETYLTTQAINCTGYANIELKFYRWLCVESALFNGQPCDHARLEVSIDPSDPASWVVLYQNPDTTTQIDTAWTLVTYDISSVADNQPQVYIRWVMGTTDFTYNYGGWNIDDVELTGVPNPPDVPLQPDLLPEDDSGVSDSDNITGVDNPRIDIYVSDPNLMFVEIYNDDVLLGQATQQSTYQWQYQLQAVELNIGENQITTVAADLGGFSETSSPLFLNYKSHTLVSDFNSDGIADIIDLASFSSAWLTSCTEYDISNPNDGMVNLLDYVVFAELWQQTELWR